MKKKIKKAFTLVELLVVIAILAILATVSIVGYNSFTKKAKVSNDTALVSQLNTLLKADSMVNGDAKTPTDALKITSEAGYDVEKLTPTTNDYEIIWNQAINQFALLDEKENVVYGEKNEGTDEYKNWKFVNEYDANSTYSMYLKGNTTTTSIDNLTVGLDVGNNTEITTINYINTSGNSKDVVIRTNSFETILNINAETDVVKHYNNAKEVNITKVALSSYHEYGSVSGNINLAQGHVVLENGSSISNVVVKTISDVTPTNEKVKLTVEDKASVNLVISNVTNVTALVDGSGKDNVSKINSTSDKSAAIGSTLYNDFTSAYSAAKKGDIITVLKDETINGCDVRKSVTIDLNGNNLTSSRYFFILNNYDLNIKNGNLIYNGETSGKYVFYLASFGNLSLNNVTLDGGNVDYSIYPGGDGSYININHSNISNSICGIATNASGYESNNIKISITNSSFDCTETAVWINVPGSVEICNSNLEAGLQALMVRGGTVNVKNSKITLTDCINEIDTSAKESRYMGISWRDGNNIPVGAIVLGDYNSGSYNYTASCSLYNTNISTTISDFNREIIVLAQDGNNETIFNFDSLSNINDNDYVICNKVLDGLKRGLITVNGVVKQQKDN